VQVLTGSKGFSVMDLWDVSASLRVERVSYAQGNVLVVIGEIDLATAPTLEAALATLPETGDVIVDLDQVSFLGVVGMRLLLHCARAFRARGQRFSVCALRPLHRRLLSRLDILDELVCDEANLRFEVPPDAD
jgi:anti-anti-sigma factor